MGGEGMKENESNKWSAIRVPTWLKSEIAKKRDLLNTRRGRSQKQPIWLADPTAEELALWQVVARLLRISDQLDARRQRNRNSKDK